MYSPFLDLALSGNVLGNHADKDIANLTVMGANWRRTSGFNLGYLVGTFQITGDESTLTRYMNQWLGMHLTERSSRVTWEGITAELTLQAGITRRRSLDNVINRVRSLFGNMLINGGFERGSGNTFTSWGQSVGGGDSITQETTEIGEGDRAVQLTNGGSGSTYLSQSVTIGVEAKATYRLDFYTRGDGTVGGRYQIRDNSGVLLALTDNDVTGDSYKKVSVEFTTKASTTSLTIRLYAPSAAGDCYYDQVALRRTIDGRAQKAKTDWADNAASQGLYGIKEAIINVGEHSYPEAPRDAHLAKHAWPRLERLSRRSRGGEAVLTGMVVGYGITTKWQYTQQVSNGSEIAADDLMEALLGEAQYINTLVINSNTSVLIRLDGKEKTIYDAIQRAVEAGDGNGAPWRFYVTAGRTAVYEQVDYTPKYILHNGRIANSLTSPISDIYTVTPGIVRDIAYPSRRAYPNDIYQDAGDFLMDEVVAEWKKVEGKPVSSLDWKVGDF